MECKFCSKTFKTYPNWIKRGGGKFCSRVCYTNSLRNRVEKECEQCGSKFSVKPCALVHNASRFCSPKCSQVSSKERDYSYCTGENNPNWKGGSSIELYPPEFNDDLKDKIRKRDNYECQICGLREEEHVLLYSYNLNIHHIDYDKDNSEEVNLVSLCCQCHGRTNYNREDWITIFSASLLTGEKA